MAKSSVYKIESSIWIPILNESQLINSDERKSYKRNQPLSLQNLLEWKALRSIQKIMTVRTRIGHYSNQEKRKNIEHRSCTRINSKDKVSDRVLWYG
jgi:hypothetical protein